MRGLAKWAGTAWVKRTRTPLALSPIKAARLGLDLCAFTPALDRLAAVPRSPLSVDPIHLTDITRRRLVLLSRSDLTPARPR